MICVLEFLKRGNFRCTDSSVGVEAQLSNLASVTQVVDPKLHKHLGIFLHMGFCILFMVKFGIEFSNSSCMVIV